jgi:hypothetical protein
MSERQVQYDDGEWSRTVEIENTDDVLVPRTLPTREQVAEAIAKSQDADYWTDEIAAWEALEQWERDAQPDNYPGMAYEDRTNYLDNADAVLALIDKGAG